MGPKASDRARMEPPAITCLNSRINRNLAIVQERTRFTDGFIPVHRKFFLCFVDCGTAFPYKVRISLDL